MPGALIEHTIFKDRTAAGKALGQELRDRKLDNPVLLALPRGGVPVAVEIARELHAPLDLLLVRKIGVPGNEELALGAVVDGQEPQVFINESIRLAIGISDAEIDQIKSRALREIERRRSLYLHERRAVPLADTTAIIVDDGIATGATIRAGLQALRLRKPARIIIATPVASPETVGHLQNEVDEVVCLVQPEPMHAISLFYQEFPQVPDEQVVKLLESMPGRS